jgi:hypothetical protein
MADTILGMLPEFLIAFLKLNQTIKNELSPAYVESFFLVAML